MKSVQRTIALAALSALVAGCSSGSAGPNGIPKVSTTNPLSTGKLEFAVGTANIYGTATGLNVVSTYRQSNGLSNVLVDTPTIKGPFALPAYTPVDPMGPYYGFDPYTTLPAGPSIVETTAGGEITGTSQNVHIGTPTCDQVTPCTEANATGGTTTIPPNSSTFGQAGGVFVNGISPGNYTQSGVASSYVPYTEPLYDTTGNEFVPFGGPPEFPGDSNGLGLRDGLFNLGAGVLGIPLGISTFEGVTPSAGTYSLSLQVPTGNNGSTESYGTVTATAALASTVKLATVTAPTPVEDGKGGATFAVTLPAGATEGIIQVVDFGLADGNTNCQGAIGASASLPVYYTIPVTASGTATLPDTIGPNSTVANGASKITPSPSLCTAAENQTATGSSSETGDLYAVQVIAADYPLLESLYPNSTSQTPTLAGSNGQADISISAMSASSPNGYAIIRRAIEKYQREMFKGGFRLPTQRNKVI